MCEPYLDLNSSKSTVKLTRIQLGTLSSRRVRACAFSRPVVSSSCGPPGSSEYALLQAQILEWVAIPFSRGSSYQGWNPGLPHCGRILYHLSHRDGVETSGDVPWNPGGAGVTRTPGPGRVPEGHFTVGTALARHCLRISMRNKQSNGANMERGRGPEPTRLHGRRTTSSAGEAAGRHW